MPRKLIKRVQVLTLSAALIGLVFLEGSTTADASTGSKSFNFGFHFITDANPDNLFNAGYAGVFGATGLPVSQKAQAWCSSKSYVTRIRTAYPNGVPNVKDWIKGCVSASMTLKLTRSNGQYQLY